MSQDDASHVGKEFGNYRIAEVLGRGGSSVVYRAIHRTIESEVAIKVLRRSSSEDLVRRFLQEAIAASQIRHPGIASVFDYGQHTEGDAYLVMELLQGENIGDRLRRRGRLDSMEAVRLMRQACGALIAAHDAGIVHRDIKPQNLFIVRDSDIAGGERIKILDFGVAKLLASTEPSDRHMLIGTPLYMAPEQLAGGDDIGPRTDIYQVGAVLYHMIVGRPPSADGSNLESIHPELDALIGRCLQRDPARRYSDMRALEDHLRRYLAEPTVALDQSPTIVTRTTDLNRQELTANISRARGLYTLSSASVASGFFRGAALSKSRVLTESDEALQLQIKNTFEFYRTHLTEEYRQLSSQIRSSHQLWIACVGVGFLILLIGLVVVLLGKSPRACSPERRRR